MHTDGVIGDYFTLESYLVSTRTADAYQAIDKSRNTPHCLWIMKHPLALNSEAVRRFLTRMQKIDEIRPPLAAMSAYGVDAAGMAFALFPPLDGFTVVSGNIETTEAERRFVACVRAIDRLHANGVVCGDLCGASFWVDRLGDISLVGLMGSFDSEALATTMLPTVETIPFIAPEQRCGGGLEPATDVFALGVLAYYLLTHSYPFGQGAELMLAEFDFAKMQRLDSFGIVPPVWAEEVMAGCLHPDPQRRYPCAGAVLKAIADIRQRIFSQERIPVLKGERSASLVATSGRKGTCASPVLVPVINAAFPREAKVKKPIANMLTRRARIFLLMITGVVLLLLMFQVVSWRRQRFQRALRPYLPVEIKDVLPEASRVCLLYTSPSPRDS